MSEITKKVVMHCPICGNDQFEALDKVIDDNFINAPENTRFRCPDCKSVFTKAELLAENQESIDLTIDELKKEAIKEFEKKLKKMFK